MEIKFLTKAIIETKFGNIEITFFDEVTNTVKNFVSLAESGFYDGLTFHRCIPDFVVQGGCPQGTGTGGPGYSIPCETDKNTEDKHKHHRGSLSMAHAGKNTGGSQFFLVRAPQPHLDGKHTVFGKITDGLEIIDELSNGDKMNRVRIIEKSQIIENHTLIKI
jgi:peptidyl-prolyl cis-trans isomerase B (cyclophilin B)